MNRRIRRKIAKRGSIRAPNVGKPFGLPLFLGWDHPRTLRARRQYARWLRIAASRGLVVFPGTDFTDYLTRLVDEGEWNHRYYSQAAMDCMVDRGVVEAIRAGGSTFYGTAGWVARDPGCSMVERCIQGREYLSGRFHSLIQRGIIQRAPDGSGYILPDAATETVPSPE